MAYVGCHTTPDSSDPKYMLGAQCGIGGRFEYLGHVLVSNNFVGEITYIHWGIMICNY